MNTQPISFSDILQLSVSERIQLVEDIWDSLREVPDEFGLSDAQRKELARRAEEFYKNPNEGIPWKTLKANLLNSK
ncbi:MAG: addiction module protein [Ignavibacteriales bacterium]|nr:addiction module protein [Ignavibacteriales bacterium]